MGDDRASIINVETGEVSTFSIIESGADSQAFLMMKGDVPHTCNVQVRHRHVFLLCRGYKIMLAIRKNGKIIVTVIDK